jgi:hypothetical protein
MLRAHSFDASGMWGTAVPEGDMKQPSLDELTGNLAIGSVVVGGVTLIVHAFSDMKGFFTWITSLAVWEVVIAIPVLFLSYVVGLLTIRLSAWWHDSRRREGPGLHAEWVLSVGRTRSDFIAAEYARTVRELEILQGAVPAVICLVCGLTVKLSRTAPDIGGHLHWGRAVFLFVDIGLIVVAILLRKLARRQHMQVLSLIAAIDSTSLSERVSYTPSASQLKLSGSR